MASRVPDAWDDDYETVADSKPDPTPAEVSKPTRAQRKAQHAASQKALWDSAENQNSLPFFIHANGSEPPLKTNHKGMVQVLSRKPKEAQKKTGGPPLLIRRSENEPGTGPENGVNGISLAQNSAEPQQQQEEEELDSEDEARLEQERTLKQRQERARLDREQKLRKYEETRRRIFGNDNGEANPDKSAASPNGRSRGGGNGNRGARGGGSGGSRNNSRPTSAAQSPARTSAALGHGRLFDPDAFCRPTNGVVQRGALQSQVEAQTFRQPRGPDGSGRGFAGMRNDVAGAAP
ncbi:MAG: hypothetical protein Q9159_002911 [Coniocarpon cinnabarinum]